jgi:hypothetical protein
MSDSSVLAPDVPTSDSKSYQLPISSIVRAVCEAANGGPDLLYEVMIKMSLMVEATAPTYGLSIWALRLTAPTRTSRACAGLRVCRKRKSRRPNAW